MLTREQVVKELVDRFLAWPLPSSVCSDLCATKQGYPHRSGTTLLSADEAKQMIEYLFAEHIAHDAAQRDALATSEKERVRWQKYYETGLKVDAELKARIATLEAALRALYDEQNGAPLETRAVDWTMAMHQAQAALKP